MTLVIHVRSSASDFRHVPVLVLVMLVRLVSSHIAVTHSSRAASVRQLVPEIKPLLRHWTLGTDGASCPAGLDQANQLHALVAKLKALQFHAHVANLKWL